jgi:hypothetical protein
MSQLRTLSLFAIAFAALVVGLASTPASGRPVDGQLMARSAPPAGDEERDSPSADRDEDARAGEPDSSERREPPARMRSGRAALSDEEIETAFRYGRSDRGKNMGLVIRDAGRGLMNALNALADEPTEGSGFWIEIYTPVSWLRQLSSDAAREYRDLSRRDLEPADLAGVLRVTVHPDMPDRVSHRGMRLSASVEHVVIRPKGRKDVRVLQPLSTRTFDETTRGRHGRVASFAGVEAIFDLDAVNEMRELSRDGEFDVIVVGEGDREKVFSVKKKHFDRLPGLAPF